MKYINQEIVNELTIQGAKLVRFVDISHLSEVQNRQFPNAIIFVLPLTARYIEEVCDTPNYVKDRIEDNFNFDDDEYLITENKTHELSDNIAKYITEKGYKAFSQSDASLIAEGKYDEAHRRSLLPNKTIAIMGGVGWIGKNNLLITSEYGAAQCLGTVLTDAPLETVLNKPLLPKCGKCSVCVDICGKQVLKNKKWNPSTSRDEIVDVYGCSTCLKCLVHCPRTLIYVKKNL
ncbi:epoxyqueuosine reductase [Dysgonomonas sp. Marseille-P4677]|uniref:epoxyqueuosine reductase n=1 Tax=Dysgonomonas sp. Marseille-P4677 TaxID=2364790 RepID=UPI001911AADF|nr:epoxyqueuosine reductase [Dysgonomonas sp. Marseille-P4677]MBK5721817.1 epoxyqueuosine reductase [Dysgonomonas sp. Marseille-P4677]